MKRFLKACWQGTRFCFECVASFAMWSLWLALAILLGLQIYIATAQELAVPRFVLREISERFSASGLRMDFERARFDPSGRLLVEGVSIVSLLFGEPLLSARSLYLRLDPWNLLLRDVDLTEIKATAVDLHVPAMISPTGRNESVIRDLHATLRFNDDDSTIELIEANARYADLVVTAAGALTPTAARPESLPLLDDIVRHYLRFARHAARLTPEFDAFESPRISLVFTPDPARIASVNFVFHAEAVALPAGRFGLPGPLRVVRPVVGAVFPLTETHPVELVTHVQAGHAEVDGVAVIENLRAHVTSQLIPSTFSLEPQSLVLTASHASGGGFAGSPVHLRLQPLPNDRLRADLDVAMQGRPWTVSAEFDPATREGLVRFAGDLPRPVFAAIARRFDEGLNRLVQYEDPPSIESVIHLGPGGRPLRATGSLRTGPVVARNVPLLGVVARFAWEGSRVRVEDIELRTPASIAHGSYTMDTETRGFRFLLEGGLQPADIEGWFRDWWPRFWATFDFSRSTPQANVDVAGTWGRPQDTTVFVQASGGPAGLRGVSIDRLYTRLFVRPGFIDVLHFHATQGERSARGGFTRTQDLFARALSSLTFSLESDLPAEAAARLAGPTVMNLAGPYRFTSPPELKVAGRLDGPAAPGGPHTRITIAGHTGTPMTFYDFPLSRLAFVAAVEGERVRVEKVVAGFADGEVRGQGELSGPADARRLAFDGQLDNAVLGIAIRTVEEFGARRAGEPPAPQSRIQQRVATGRLDLAFSAEGLRRDLRSFQGSGNARISQADLGEINLLGVLSTLLRRTLLNYSTLQLDTAHANFDLAGPKLEFSEIRLTGPRAAIDASGTYDFDSKTVDFLTKVHPFEESRGLLGSALGTVLAPLSAFLEVKLTGRLDEPSWSFVYGPTNFFRTLTGSETYEPISAPESPPKSSPSG